MFHLLLGTFRYSQAGTPSVKVTSHYNAEARTFTLKFRYSDHIELFCWRSLSFLLIILFNNLVVDWTHSNSQEVPPTPGQPTKEPMFIPVAIGLLDSNGKDMALSSVFHDGKLQALSSNNQPVYSTVLRVTKVGIFTLSLLFRYASHFAGHCSQLSSFGIR